MTTPYHTSDSANIAESSGVSPEIGYTCRVMQRWIGPLVVGAMIFAAVFVGFCAVDVMGGEGSNRVGFPPTPDPTRQYCAEIYGEDDPVGLGRCLGL